MDEILSIKKLIEMLSIFPAETPLLNAPNKPYTYLKTKNIAFVAGETIFDQNPTQPVGEFVSLLNRIMINEYQVGVKVKEDTHVYLVSQMHQAGTGVLGFKMTSRGISLIKASMF
jgi:hypothetical protein